MAAILYKQLQIPIVYRIRNIFAEQNHEFIPRSVHQYISRKSLCMYNLSNTNDILQHSEVQKQPNVKSDL